LRVLVEDDPRWWIDPVAVSVNDEPLTSAPTIEAGIDAGLLIAINNGAVFVGAVTATR
jgi:hypothetical protein